MGKTSPIDKTDVALVEIGGHRLVIMEEEQYERLLDAIDVAEAERILNDPNEKPIPWERARKEILRDHAQHGGSEPTGRESRKPSTL